MTSSLAEAPGRHATLAGIDAWRSRRRIGRRCGGRRPIAARHRKEHTTGDGFAPATIIKELYPDQATFKAEEQRRFALLLEHMEVPVRVDNLSTWK